MAAIVLAAALAGAASAVLVYQRHASVRVEMARGLPAFVTGFYAPERQGRDYFAWSRERVRLRLDLVDRRVAWECRAAVVNWRPPSAGPASVRVESGGRTLLDRQVTEPRAPLDFTVPPDRARPDLDFTIDVSPTFVPGPQDQRQLGLVFEGLRCDPAPGARARLAGPAVARAALAAALVALALSLAGMPAAVAAVLGLFVAIAQAFSLATGTAAHVLTGPPACALAALMAAFCLLPVLAARALRRPLSPAAKAAVGVSACALYLKLIFLLHPDKTVVDALFHAHRLDMVLAGRLLFTQLSTSATPFPYAVGLYVFAAPWALFVSDHVTLLRLVVCASEAAAVLLLYPLVVRHWGDRMIGVAAVALYHLAPLPFAVIGNANLTNHFGQSAALAAMAAAAGWAFAGRRTAQVAGLTVITALAFLSHVGTFAVLLPTLLVLALLTHGLLKGTGRGAATGIATAAALAVLLAAGLYYAHFTDVYRPHLAALKADVTAVLGSGGRAVPGAAPAGSTGIEHQAPPLQLGFSGAARQTRGAFGLPLIALALAGGWSLARRRRVDRLVLALAAWLTSWAAFLLWSTIRRVEPRYVQDAWEFIGRIEMATTPAVAILAACGAVWAWRAGWVPRAVAAALLVLAFGAGAQAMGAWVSY